MSINKLLKIYSATVGAELKVKLFFALWFFKNGPPQLEEIRVIFPVREHSFCQLIVFGRLEKS